MLFSIVDRILMTGSQLTSFLISFHSYAPWCPACRNLEPVWNDFGSWSDDLQIKVAKVDVV